MEISDKVKDEIINMNGHGGELRQQQIDALISEAQLHKPLNPAQDFIDGKMFYGVKVGSKKCLISSEHKMYSLEDIVSSYFLTDKGFNRSGFSIKGIDRYLKGETVNPQTLYVRLRDFFKRFVANKAKETPSVLALWVMATYVYQIFRWFPYLWFTSLVKRSGKTISLEMVHYTSFNSTPVMATPTESYLFREVSANGSTIILDELEQCRNKDRENFGGIMALLNVGFKKGGVVPRSDKNGQKFSPTHYAAYSPKAFAGINDVTDTLEDRSLKIVMLRKKKSEKVERFNIRQWEEPLNSLRDELYIFGLSYGTHIASIYDQPDSLLVPDELDDRAKDIFEPLFAIAKVVMGSSNQEVGVMEDLKSFALDQAGIRADAEQDDGLIVHFVEILTRESLGDEGSRVFTPDDLLTLLIGKSWGGLESKELDSDTKKKRRIGRYMKKLDLYSKPYRVKGQVVRGYLLTNEIINDLRERYQPLSEHNTPQDCVTSVTLDGKEVKNGSVTNGNVTDEYLKSLQYRFSSMIVTPVTDVTD